MRLSRKSKPPTAKPPINPLLRTPSFSDYLRVFTYARKWDYVVYLVAGLASLGAGAALPLMNIIFGHLVGQFAEFFRPTNTTLTRAEFEKILDRQALYITILFLGRWLLNAVNRYAFRTIGVRISSDIRRHYLRALLAQSVHVVDALPAGAPALAITATADALQMGISERLGTFLQFNGTIWAALAIAFVWSWDLTLVTLSLILYIAIVLSFVFPVVVRRQQAADEANLAATAVAGEALGGIRLVMACGAQRRVVARYERWVREGMRRGMKAAPLVGAQFGLIFFGVLGTFGLAFWYGARRYLTGKIVDAGVVIVVLMSVVMVISSLERIATPLLAVGKAMVAACQLFTVIDAPAPSMGTLKPDISSADLVFDDVTFEYPGRPGVKVLDGLSFRIRPGQNVAIVGPSGAGKSTIVGLIERWYALREPYVLPKVANLMPVEKSDDKDEHVEDTPRLSQLAGCINIGGVNLDELDMQWWRSQIGLVQQEPFLFNDTIFANVANGLVGTPWEREPEFRRREMVQQACMEANAHEFVCQMPSKYDTRVGDGGIKLSGGQKQRLAIARSIIKKPRILILDEATSSIDAKSEHLVQAALDSITRNHTTITIAHRLSTIKKADHIVVLAQGQAVEQGTHKSLMSNSSGLYHHLVQAQALHFSSPLDMADYNEPLVFHDCLEKLASAPEIPAASYTFTPYSPPSRAPRGFVRTFGKLLYHQRAKWPSYLGIVVSAAAVAAGTPLQSWLFARVIGIFLLDKSELGARASFWGLMWLALAVGVGLSWFAEAWVGIRAQQAVSAAYKIRYLSDMLRQEVSYFDDDRNPLGALAFRVGGDAKLLEELLGMNTALFISGIFTILGCAVISFVFSWKLGLLALFVTMPVMLATGFWKFRQELQFEQSNALVFLESSQFATEAVGAFRTVSSLGLEPAINARYENLLAIHTLRARRRARWTAGLFGFADSVGLACQALVFWYGGRLLARGELASMEAFFVCFMAIIQGAEAAGQALSAAPSAAQAYAAATRMLELRESVTRETTTVPDLPSTTRGGMKIELRDVNFAYPSRNVGVLENLNLTVEKGQFAALVGASGSGKSTVISLLERFYTLEPEQGAVLFDGVDVTTLPVHHHRRNLSLVPQEPTIFFGTIRENVLFGIPTSLKISDAQLEKACRDAYIHDFIVSLPEGYDTDVGLRGIAMSGGQRQRIALARALIRDPRVLLLDEATSALDSEAEGVVMQALEEAREGRTVVAVAHRLATIQHADVIFVLAEGRVVERGTHEELLGYGGVYWDMCRNQALDR
ncbi:ABC transporter BEA3 [Colletotrichum spinosum]|uniref:ABC transporter BEA3 n=1 Tax=Colletotrichum spinosum TaxID=1347390 RepID=A0A4R8QW19_9PEZI|nr:ABC transporter BEA3 [Colletotrichum spinosum]